MIPCFFGGFCCRLGAKHFERANQARPRLARLDHFVDLAGVGGHVGVHEAVVVLGDELALQGRRVRRRLQLPSLQHADGAHRPHDGNLRRWPRKRHVAAHLLEHIATYAPPMALRVTMVIFGTVAWQKA